LQHTPSAQNPDAHSFPDAQSSPAASLHSPLASHVFAPVQLSGSAAFKIGAHAPVALEQALHVPHASAMQQAPSTHDTPSHSSAVVQVPLTARYSQVSFRNVPEGLVPPKSTVRFRFSS
jgi:hypothetical protein